MKKKKWKLQSSTMLNKSDESLWTIESLLRWRKQEEEDSEERI